MSDLAVGSSDPSPIATIIFAGILVMVGLGLVAAAKDLRAARDRHEPPMFPEWFSGGWYERRPMAVRAFGWSMAGVGTVLLLLGVAQLVGVMA